jgi:hypothetical protein
VNPDETNGLEIRSIVKHVFLSSSGYLSRERGKRAERRRRTVPWRSAERAQEQEAAEIQPPVFVHCSFLGLLLAQKNVCFVIQMLLLRSSSSSSCSEYRKKKTCSVSTVQKIKPPWKGENFRKREGIATPRDRTNGELPQICETGCERRRQETLSPRTRHQESLSS